MRTLKPYASYLLSMLRLVAGLLLFAHGVTKYLDFPASPLNHASPTNIFGVAGVLELVGGALLLVGLFTRPVAFILSGMTAVAYFYAHLPRSIYPILNGGEPVILFCFALLYISAAGGGAWSADRILLRSED
jgi:putative oxidoreductase